MIRKAIRRWLGIRSLENHVAANNIAVTALRTEFDKLGVVLGIKDGETERFIERTDKVIPQIIQALNNTTAITADVNARLNAHEQSIPALRRVKQAIDRTRARKAAAQAAEAKIAAFPAQPATEAMHA